jgi:endonuclease G
MKLKQLLIYSLLALTIASCSKKEDVTSSTTTPPVTTPPVTTPVDNVPYSIDENFEYGTKTGYASAAVTLSTGSWTLNDALIGNSAADAKNGAASARLRTGDITMNFDIKGITTLYIQHAKYGTDANTTWQLFESTDGGTTYTQVGKDIAETTTTLVLDSFKIASAPKVRFQIKKTSATVRVNIDDITFKGIGDPGVTVNVPDTPPADTSNTSSAATPRKVTIGSDAPPSSGDNSNLLFGNPSGASTVTNDNFLIDQGYYVESYNATKGEPNWVSWHLDATNITSASGRQNTFAAYSGLPIGDYQVQSNSYSGSGFDRGHNCPSADRTSSVNANDATFLMTNMIPQAPQNNQQTWGNLENYLRDQVTAGNEVYIVMGNYGTGGVGSLSTTVVNSINNNHVNVPSNVWKIAVILPVGNGDLARVTASTRVIAVNTPNINSINSDWTKYITTLQAIETATGFNLLSNLPSTVKASLETKVDPGS